MNLLDLFTGSGIGSLAATAAGINVVAQCENDPCCLYCLERLWPNAKQYTDVSTLTADALRRDGIGPIDIISGGFPCQDISTAGKGKGLEGERSGLWFQMRRLIDEIRPAWVLAENVPALRVRGADRVLDDLEELGYACWPCVVGAHAVGAPHKRDRVWIVAQYQGERAMRLPVRSGRPQQAPIDVAGRGEEGGVQLADTNKPGRTINPCLGIDTREERTAVERNRWPARPGERQHEWEHPRLVAFADARAWNGIGDERDQGDKRGDGDAGPEEELSGQPQLGMGDAANGLARRLRGRTNKALLRMAGNGWIYPIPEMIFRWIVEVEKNAT